MDPLLEFGQHSISPSAELAGLRQRAEEIYTLRDVPLIFPRVDGTPRTYHIALPADPDAPLDQFAMTQHWPSAPPNAPSLLAETLGEREHAGAETQDAATTAAQQARAAVTAGVHMPYWGLLWPSGIALAEEVLARPDMLRERNVLELGCGLGATATAALDAGASLLAADCFDEALLFTRYNSLRNTGQTPSTTLLDWRTEAGRVACLAAAPFDLLLAADVLYEQENLDPLLTLVPDLLAPGGAFWLAEPGRRVSQAFVAAARASGWHDDERVYQRSWPPYNDKARVAVHHFTLPHAAKGKTAPR
ncbi:MAG TPA: methyltransferase domain-containing protein [Ktedonobacterales bacterium]